MSQIIKSKNGKNIKVIETECIYADTKRNRDLNRVGKTYKKRRFQIQKGGNSIMSQMPDLFAIADDVVHGRDPTHRIPIISAKDAEEGITDAIGETFGNIPIIGQFISGIYDVGKLIGDAVKPRINTEMRNSILEGARTQVRGGGIQIIHGFGYRTPSQQRKF
jgi:hypothetical protein